MKPFSVRKICVFGLLLTGIIASYWFGAMQAHADDPVQCQLCCCKQVYAFGGISATQSTGYKEDISGNGTHFSDPRLNAVVDGNGAEIPVYSNGCVHINASGPFNPLLYQFPTGGPVGAPVLTWHVSVAPSRPGYVIYWITVKNLTAVTIPFEGHSYAVEAGSPLGTGLSGG